jgi:crotonobetainyl-CoA:carnitine CoA-transferase CaiB-like acyl-CoA transferase
MNSGPLEGVRVLDLTRVLAGPFATLLLADLGAEVWKVEHPAQGDETRQIPPLANGESHYFASINRNKKSVAVDLKDPRGRELALGLAARADVVVENFRPKVSERLGLSYDQLRAENPRLVYCSISAFGQTGPWADRTAFDVSIQALSGLMSLTGEPGGAPVRAGLPMADLTAGLMGVVGILSALVERDKSGLGQYVDTSMLDSMVGMLTYLAGRWFMTGEEVSRVGSGHPSAVPYGAYPTADGHIVLATLYESYWPVLCRAVGRPDLADDPELATNEQRLARRAEVDAELSSTLTTRTTAAWEEVFGALDLPTAPILSVGEVLSHPQVTARGLVHHVDHPRLGHTGVVGPTVTFSRSAAPEPVPAPLLGQDTVEVLSSVLGLSDEQIAALVHGGVVATPPVSG